MVFVTSNRFINLYQTHLELLCHSIRKLLQQLQSDFYDCNILTGGLTSRLSHGQLDKTRNHLRVVYFLELNFATDALK